MTLLALGALFVLGLLLAVTLLLVSLLRMAKISDEMIVENAQEHALGNGVEEESPPENGASSQTA